MFEHGRMNAACERKVRELKADLKSLRSSGRERVIASHLLELTSAFVILQDQRHTADYDNGMQWSLSDVTVLVETVADAFKSWHAIREEPVAQNFLGTLLPRER
jgi:hypothetical protein